jgi:hypothetical protein
MVVYRTGFNKTGTAYSPLEWFKTEAKKAELIQLGTGKNAPSMSVFYKAGAFYSVRLYVSRSPSHSSWGVVPSDAIIDSRFEGVETLEIQY